MSFRPQLCTGAEFRAMRKQAKISQKKFADLTGVHLRTVRRWEQEGSATPKWALFIVRILIAKRQALITGQSG